MRLEPLFRVSMRYADAAWIRPVGASEGPGLGWGEGTVTGDVLRGQIRWANYPRRREDGVWTPNLRGVIHTEDGAEILISLHGQSVQEASPTGVGRAILTRVELLSAVGGTYGWLNTSFIVGEGEIDEDTDEGGGEGHGRVNAGVTPSPAL